MIDIELLKRNPFVIPCVGLLGGILCGSLCNEKVVLWCLASIISLIIVSTILCIIKKRLFLITIFIIFAGIGLQRCITLSTIPADHYSYFVKKNSSTYLDCKVISYPKVVITKYGQKNLMCRVRINALYENRKKRKVRGEGTIISKYPDKEVLYGDLLSLSAVLKENSFFISKMNAKHISVIKKHHILSFINQKKSARVEYYLQQLSYPANIFLCAVLLGENRYVYKSELYTFFKKAGILHILAISGFHFVLLLLMVNVVLQIFCIQRMFRYFINSIFCLFYIFLVGYKISVIRSGIMILVYLFSMMVSRQYRPVNTLALAGGIMLFVNPSVLYSVSFQLSFVCVCSIILVSNIIKCNLSFNSQSNQSIWKYRVHSYFLQIIGIWIFITPLCVYHFQRINFVAIISNCFIYPFIFLCMASAFLLVIFTGIHNYSNIILEKLYEVIFELFYLFVKCIAKIPWIIEFKKHVHGGAIIIIYLFLLIFILSCRKKKLL